MKKFTVPKPCHEKWENMLPEEKDRFCTSCQTKVYDFSQSADHEIQEIYEREKGNVCGMLAGAPRPSYLQKTAANFYHFTRQHCARFSLFTAAASFLMVLSGCGKPGSSPVSAEPLVGDSLDYPTDTAEAIVVGKMAPPRADTAQMPNKAANETSTPSTKNEGTVPKEMQTVPTQTDQKPVKIKPLHNPPSAPKPNEMPSGAYPLGKIAPKNTR